MTWLLDIFALPLAVAAGIGLVTGWACAAGSPGRLALPGILAWAGLAGALAAALLVVEGRAALWAETGLLMLGAYLAACALACGLRRLSAG